MSRIAGVNRQSRSDVGRPRSVESVQGNCSIPWMKIGLWESRKWVRVDEVKWFVSARWMEKGR